MIQGLYDIFSHWHAQGTVWLYSDPHFGDKELAAGVAVVVHRCYRRVTLHDLSFHRV